MGVTSSEERAAALFGRIARSYEGVPGISRGKMLVSEGLRLNGRFFAAFVRGELLIKLPRERVQKLISSGVAAPFKSGKNTRVTNEWALISPSASRRWRTLVEESLAFVRQPVG